MKQIRNIHPGEILQEEFLFPMDISAYRLAKDIHIPQTRISAIISGRRSITADTALRLSMYFGNSPKFWLGLQNDFDVEEQRRMNEKELQGIVQFLVQEDQVAYIPKKSKDLKKAVYRGPSGVHYRSKKIHVVKSAPKQAKKRV